MIYKHNVQSDVPKLKGLYTRYLCDGAYLRAVFSYIDKKKYSHLSGSHTVLYIPITDHIRVNRVNSPVIMSVG